MADWQTYIEQCLETGQPSLKCFYEGPMLLFVRPVFGVLQMQTLKLLMSETLTADRRLIKVNPVTLS